MSEISFHFDDKLYKGYEGEPMAAALPLALIASTPSPASAATVGAGLVQGSGSISPGLGAVPTAQNFSFGGSVTGAIVNGTTPSLSARPAAFSPDHRRSGTATKHFVNPWPGERNRLWRGAFRSHPGSDHANRRTHQ